MIQAQATATRIACARMTMAHLSALRDSVERASGLAARSEWDRKAAAHAEIFVLLADVADDPVLAPLLKGGAAHARELMLVVGRAADGMIVSSQRRLLERLRAGDGDGAALEMERHLRGLHFMWRLARGHRELARFAVWPPGPAGRVLAEEGRQSQAAGCRPPPRR